MRHLKAYIQNILIIYVIYLISAGIFLFENWGVYAESIGRTTVASMIGGLLLYATSAIAYTNIPYTLLMLLPLNVRERAGWQKVAKWVYIIVNSAAFVVNEIDSVLFKYTGRRTTCSFFAEFANNNNLGDIFWSEVGAHWYLIIAAVIIIVLLSLLYRSGTPKKRRYRYEATYRRVPITTTMLEGLVFIIIAIANVTGMRGGLSYHRPISIADASRFVSQPRETNIILNTPFTLIRTIGKATFEDPKYYTVEELDRIYSPTHRPKVETDSIGVQDSSEAERNVVVILLESFSSEYLVDHAPFLNDLMRHSITFEQSYENGMKSIDALPSVITSIPMFVEPYILTQYSNNTVNTLASELGKVGYRTAFFHGADNNSMGFRAYCRTAGYQDYYGMDEYCKDPRFRGERDFDGYWAIWDEEFLRYSAFMMDTMREPFMTTIFTATSHHPYNIPERYKTRYTGGTLPIHRAIEYTDHALQQFFAYARQKEWYGNTIFVITADHTNQLEKAESQTSIGMMRIPILLYDPTGRLKPEEKKRVAQQIDIMPTVLGMLKYDRPYIAFGKDLLDEGKKENWAVNYINGMYQYVEGDTLIQFDGRQLCGVYNHRTDPLLRHNRLNGENAIEVKRQERRLKAIIQSYMSRMTSNRLTVR